MRRTWIGHGSQSNTLELRNSQAAWLKSHHSTCESYAESAILMRMYGSSTIGLAGGKRCVKRRAIRAPICCAQTRSVSEASNGGGTTKNPAGSEIGMLIPDGGRCCHLSTPERKPGSQASNRCRGRLPATTKGTRNAKVSTDSELEMPISRRRMTQAHSISRAALQ